MSSESDDSAHAHGPQKISRRGLLKGTAAGGAAAVGLGAGDAIPGLEGTSAVGDAEAIGCGGLCIAGGIALGAAATGWALREFEIVGSDAPAEGLTAGALTTQASDTAETRKSVNQSTFVDNQNLIQNGMKSAAYSDGKLAAIKEINNQKSQSEVESAATTAADVQESTVKKNVLKSWNEAAAELGSMETALENHADTAVGDVFEVPYSSDSGTTYQPVGVALNDASVTLPDGTTMDLHRVGDIDEATTVGVWRWEPTTFEFENSSANARVIVDRGASGEFTYLEFGTWDNLFTSITTAFDEVRNGLLTWVDSVYSQVQAGDLDPAELLTPAELAELSSGDGETLNKAIQDLIALNVPVNLDREAEIHLTNSGTTLYGSLGTTAEGTLSAGTSIVPSSSEEQYYLSFDASEAHGTWSAVNESVDGGTVTFTEEPHPSVLWTISTGAQETAEVASSDFTDNADGTWSVDISGQVETAITTVAEVKFYSDSETTKMETVLLDEPFDIVAFTDSNGEDVSSADYTKPAEPESDTNYITKKEWENREKKYKDLIDKYEESQSGGGGLPSFGDFSPRQMIVGAVVVGGSILGISSLSS